MAKWIVFMLVFFPAFGIATFFWMATHTTTRCEDVAFTQSLAYGQDPRRFFEMRVYQVSKDFIPEITYLISFQEIPQIYVTVSSLTCKVIKQEMVSEEEIKKFWDERNKKSR